MAQHEIETQWMGKMQFNSLVNGHTIIMDAPERVGGEDHALFQNHSFLPLFPAVQGWTLSQFSGTLKKK